MKYRTRTIAFWLVMAMVLSVVFVSCKQGEKGNNPASENNGIIEEGLTKEYFESNKYEVVANSINFEELFGFNDEVFNVFRNEKFKDGTEVLISLHDEELDARLKVAATEKPFKFRYDVWLDGEDNTYDKPIEGSVYADSEKLSVEFESVLGDKAAGIEFGNIYDMIKDFSESDLAAILGAPSYEEIVDAIEKMGIDEKTIDEVLNSSVEFCEMYFSEQYGIFSEFEKNITDYSVGLFGNVSESTIDSDGKKIPVLTIELSIDNNNILDFMDLVFDMYEEYYIGMGDFADEIANVAGVEEPLELTEDALYMIDQIRNETYLAFDMIDVSGTGLSYFDKKTGKYIQSDYTVKLTVGQSDVQSEEIVITGTEYVKDKGIVDELVIEIDEENTVDAKLSISGNSGDKYSLVLNGELVHRQLKEKAVYAYGIEIDKASKVYKLFTEMTTPDNETKAYVTGYYDYTDSSLTVSVEKIFDGEEMVYMPVENRITIKTVDHIEPHENFVSIFDLTFMDILKIIKNVQDKL